MVKKAPVSKATQLKSISKTSSKEKKKWSKGKTKDGVNRNVYVDEILLAKIIKELPSNVVTKAHIAEKYNLNGGVALKILAYLEENDVLQCVSSNSMVKVYGRAKKEIEVVEIAA